MVRRRSQQESLREALALRPQANPTGGPADTVAAPDSRIFDFAPISQAVQGFLAEKARKDAEKKIQDGERWAVENPLLVADIERDLAEIKDAKERADSAKRTFADLQRQGLMPPAADPWWQVGYARAAGRQLAADYRNRLFTRMQEVSTVRGQHGPTAAPDLEAIMAEEWEAVGQAPAVQNFYGGQEALAIKSQADEEFRAKAALQRAEAQERDYQDMLKTEIGGRFDQLLASNPVVTSETLAPITQYLTEEVRGHNVLNPRELVMDALELSIQRLSSVDPDEATRAVHAAQDLVVGDLRLGDDRGPVGMRLQELTQRVRDQAREAVVRDLQLEESQRRKAVQDAEADYLPILLAAKRDGQSLTEIARRLETQYLEDDASANRFGGRGAFAVEALQAAVTQLDAARKSDRGLLDRFNVLLADGDLDGAEALIRSGMGTGSVTGEDYAQAMGALGQRRDISPFLEESGLYQAVKGRYAQAKPSGLIDDVQQQIDDDVLDRQRRLERDFAVFVRSTTGKPNREDLHRAWLAEREAADLGEIRAKSQELKTRGEQTVRDIRSRLTRFQDAGDLIDQAEREGTLPVLEAQALREEAAKAIAGRERFFTSPAYQDAEAEIDRQFAALAGGAAPDAAQLTAQRLAHQELRDRFEVGLDALLNDPAASPATFDARARSLVRATLTELGDQLFPAGRKAMEKAAQAGADAEGVLAAPAALAEDQLRAQNLAAVFADPRGRERFSASSELLPKDPAVPEVFYDTAAKWMSGLDPIFGRKMTQADIEHVTIRAARSVLTNPTLAPELRQQAIGNMLSTVGVDPLQVLADKVTFEVSDAERNEAQARLATLRAWGGGLEPHQPGFAEIGSPWKAEREELERLLAAGPMTVDMTGHQWAPYTTPFFRSVQALEAFQHDPAYPEFLARIGIEADDDDQVEAWVTAQLSAITRVNP